MLTTPKVQTFLSNFLTGPFRTISRSNPHVYRRQKEMYPCIPKYQKITPRDPFDYKLRPKEEVQEEFRNFNPVFNININYKRYNAGDLSQHKKNFDNRERVAKITLDIRHL